MVRSAVSADQVASGRRAHARVRLAIPARLITLDATRPCLLDDLSQSGARIRIADVPRIASSALLMFERVETFGVVVWTAQGQCGLAFDDPLPEAIVVQMRRFSDNRTDNQAAEHARAVSDWVAGKGRLI